MTTYKEKVEALVKALQPDIEEEHRFFEQLPVGSKFWFPCAGIESRGIKSGHVGRVDTYAGDRKWDRGEWISEEAAKSSGAKITNSHGLCGSCSKIIDESKH